MTAISAIGFAVAVCLLLLAMKKGADALSPGRLFAIVWAIVIALADLKLSALQHSWSLFSWIVLMSGVCSFILGTSLVYIININRPMTSLEAIRYRLRSEQIDEGLLYWIVCWTFVVYAIAYLIIFLVKGFIPLFDPRGAEIRNQFQIFGFGLFLQSVVCIVFLTAIYHIKVKGQTARKHILKVATFLSVVSFFSLLQRLQLVMAAVISLTFVYYSTRHLRLKTAVLYAAGATFFFFGVASLRYGEIVANWFFVQSRMKISPSLAIITEPYMYAAMNLENFTRAVDKLESHTYGYYTFDGLTALVGLKHWLKDYFNLIENPYLTSNYNTSTGFWNYYHDFGIIGVTVFPFLLGAFIGIMYYQMRRNPSTLNVSMYCLMVFVILMSFFSSPPSFLWFMYISIVTYLIVKAVAVRTTV